MTENKFPTIQDLHHCTAELIGCGLGDLPFQIVVAPDSTIQALAVALDEGTYTGKKPTLMIDLMNQDDRLPVSFISTDRLGLTPMPSINRQ